MRAVEVDGSPERVAVLVDALAAALDGGPPVLPLPPGGSPGVATAPAGTAVVIATSGSTGEPKLVALTAAALRASARATEARLGGPGRWLLALPAEHVAGVQVIVRALLAGAPPQVMDLRAGVPARGLRRGDGGPRPWAPVHEPGADAAAPHPRRRRAGRGTRTPAHRDPQARRGRDGRGPAPPTAAVPTAGRGERGSPEVGAADALAALRSYAAVLVGGAALDVATRQRALAAGVRVVTTYGMSETAGGCVYDGLPLDGVTVDLDADGLLLLGGPTLASGYLGRPGDPALAGGRFRTGDLGRWRDGRLEVLGRADDVIVTGGEKVAPAAVERVLAAQPGVLAACVAGVPDAVWGQAVAAVVVWADPPGRGDRAQMDGAADRLRAAVRAELGRAAVPRRIVTVAEIPLRGIGKPDRAAVARLVTAAGAGGIPTG